MRRMKVRSRVTRRNAISRMEGRTRSCNYTYLSDILGTVCSKPLLEFTENQVRKGRIDSLVLVERKRKMGERGVRLQEVEKEERRRMMIEI